MPTMNGSNNDLVHDENTNITMPYIHMNEGLVPDDDNNNEDPFNAETEMPSTTSSTDTKTHVLQRFESKTQDLFKGGTVFDGFLLAAAAEVGQSILTLPNIFAQLGFTAGLLLEIFFATLALYTNYLLVSMHAQYRYNLQVTNDPKHNNKYYIASYHEIMEHLVGTWLKNFSLTIVFFALLGLTTVQIIATSSNFYILSPTTSKRSWSLIWGGMFSFMLFVPTFRHYRVLAIFGILTTTYTAWFMTLYSIKEGNGPKDENVIYEYVLCR